jgi:hypothetical protein
MLLLSLILPVFPLSLIGLTARHYQRLQLAAFRELTGIVIPRHAIASFQCHRPGAYLRFHRRGQRLFAS